ncbi:cytochrome P450 [Xanthobacter autotrophicus]|uniref:cytochrome P450 n=1 Tax=Xanthobacter autotrophicus TaxID=280 RepID=UPI00372BF05F
MTNAYMSDSSYPSADLDLFSDAALLDPYPLYRQLRDQAPVVWLDSLGVYAIMRYDDVKSALRDWKTFSSAQGVGLNPAFNETRNMLQTDPPEHDHMRAIVGAPVTMASVAALTDQIQAEADHIVDAVLERGHIDGVRDLAWHLPLTIVSRFVGLPESARMQMLVWSEAASNLAGPVRPQPSPAYAGRASRAAEAIQGLFQFLGGGAAVREQVAPGSWAARLYEAADQGKIPLAMVPILLLDYIGPALETTISATGTLLALFAQHPDQWDSVRSDASLVAKAVNEAIRLDPPLPYFTRVSTVDAQIDGISIPAGSRVLLGYASANRDERAWEDPERFDVTRDSSKHLGFGHGLHSCMGMHLAKLEMNCLFNALRLRIQRIAFDGEPKRAVTNSALRAYHHLPLLLTAGAI